MYEKPTWQFIDGGGEKGQRRGLWRPASERKEKSKEQAKPAFKGGLVYVYGDLCSHATHTHRLRSDLQP